MKDLHLSVAALCNCRAFPASNSHIKSSPFPFSQTLFLFLFHLHTLIMSTKEEVTVNGTAISSEKVQTSDEEVHGKQQAPDGEGGSTDNNNVTTMVVDDEQNVRVLEKRLVRKIDLRLEEAAAIKAICSLTSSHNVHRFIPWVSLIYLLLSLDRNNIGNAKLGTLESDLHLDGNEYYTAVTIFFAGKEEERKEMKRKNGPNKEKKIYTAS